MVEILLKKTPKINAKKINSSENSFYCWEI